MTISGDYIILLRPYDRRRDPVSAFRDRDRRVYLPASIDSVYSAESSRTSGLSC